MKPLIPPLRLKENSSDYSFFSPNHSHQKSADRKPLFSQDTRFDLPIVFFEKFAKPQKNSPWSEIAYNIIRSVHSENSFTKSSSLSLKKRPLFAKEKEALSPILSETTSFRSKTQKTEEKSTFFHMKMLKISRKMRIFNKEHWSFSMNLEREDAENPDISKFLNGFKDYCRRKSCYGEIFGKPSRFEVFTDRIEQDFSTQFQKKKPAILSLNIGKSLVKII